MIMNAFKRYFSRQFWGVTLIFLPENNDCLAFFLLLYFLKFFSWGRKQLVVVVYGNALHILGKLINPFPVLQSVVVYDD